MKSKNLSSPRSRRHLLDIFIPYETRKSLLQHLSAYDVAKLDLSLNHILDDSERKLYLNPARDLIWNIDEAKSLMQDGMKLIPLGKDALVLEKRLKNPQAYLEHYGNKRRPQIYLVGIFPIRDKSEECLDRMARFGINREPSQIRILKDKFELERMRQKLADNSWDLSGDCLMSFGALVNLPVAIGKGFWSKVPEVPDHTISLRVYVPSFYDRLCEQITLSSLDILRLVGHDSSWRCIPDLAVSFLRICRQTYQLHCPGHLTTAGIQPINTPADGPFTACSSLSNRSVRIPY